MSRVRKENLDKLLSIGKKLSRDTIKYILGVSESEARAYYEIVMNYDVLFGVKKEESRVLVVSDLHEPFCLDGYLEFCLEIKAKYDCNKVVFIGDITDGHYHSFHETDPDGHSAAEELNLAKMNIARWYSAFPVAHVTIGNHDRLPDRKRFSAGLSKNWIKSVGEVLETPNWEYAETVVIDGVEYSHGEGRQARQRAKNDMISCVQGHWHSKSYIEHFVGLSEHIWAMQVGCGINRKSYAMAYGKHFDKPHINCGVVLENGALPILEYMKL